MQLLYQNSGFNTMQENSIDPHITNLILDDFTDVILNLRRIKNLTDTDIMAAFCLGMIATSQNRNMRKEEVMIFVSDLFNTIHKEMAQ